MSRRIDIYYSDTKKKNHDSSNSYYGLVGGKGHIQYEYIQINSWITSGINNTCGCPIQQIRKESIVKVNIRSVL